MTSQKALGTISRFVTWESTRRPDFTVEDQLTMNDLLQQLGVDSLRSFHGLEADSPEGLTSEVAKMLLKYDLGIVAHAYTR